MAADVARFCGWPDAAGSVWLDGCARGLGHRCFALVWTRDTLSALRSALSVATVPVLAYSVLHARPRELGVIKAAQTLPCPFSPCPWGRRRQTPPGAFCSPPTPPDSRWSPRLPCSAPRCRYPPWPGCSSSSASARSPTRSRICPRCPSRPTAWASCPPRTSQWRPHAQPPPARPLTHRRQRPM